MFFLCLVERLLVSDFFCVLDAANDSMLKFEMANLFSFLLGDVCYFENDFQQQL